MSEEKAMCITVLLKCTGCDNQAFFERSVGREEGYTSVYPELRYICMKCGVDMEIVVERTVHTATIEEVK